MVTALAVSALLILVVSATRLLHRFEEQPASRTSRLDGAVRDASGHA